MDNFIYFCSICNDVMSSQSGKSPFTFTCCMKSACESCISHLIKIPNFENQNPNIASTLENNENNENNNNQQPPKHQNCPICNEELDLVRNTVKLNVDLKDSIEKYIIKKRRKTTTLQAQKLIATPIDTSINPASTNEVVKFKYHCPHHPKSPLELYCVDENELCCIECIDENSSTFNKHKNHLDKIVTIQEALEHVEL